MPFCIFKGVKKSTAVRMKPLFLPKQQKHLVVLWVSLKNVGHALTFAILTDDTNKIIFQSEVRSAEDDKSANLRTEDWGDDHESEKIIRSKAEQSSSDGTPSECMACINPEELVGLQFEMPDPKDGNMKTVTIIKEIEDHKKMVQTQSMYRKFMVCGTIDN